MPYYRYTYLPAPPAIPFQGTKEQLAKKIRATGLKVVGGSNGSYVLAGEASGIITEFSDETSTTPIRQITPSKELIRILYHKTRVTENDYCKLALDLNSGRISFDGLDKAPRF